jgi:hypothetical protein
LDRSWQREAFSRGTPSLLRAIASCTAIHVRA